MISQHHETLACSVAERQLFLDHFRELPMLQRVLGLNEQLADFDDPLDSILFAESRPAASQE